MIEITGPDLSKLDWSLSDSNRLQRQMGDGFAGAAEQVAERIRGAAPRRTGALAESIRVARHGDRVAILAGGTADTTKAGKTGSHDAIFDEAVALEYGNSRTEAQPFFYDNANAGEPAFEAAATDALGKARE